MKFTILMLAMLSLCAVGTASAQQKKRPKKKTLVQTSEKVIYEPDAERLDK